MLIRGRLNLEKEKIKKTHARKTSSSQSSTTLMAAPKVNVFLGLEKAKILFVYYYKLAVTVLIIKMGQTKRNVPVV